MTHTLRTIRYDGSIADSTPFNPKAGGQLVVTESGFVARLEVVEDATDKVVWEEIFDRPEVVGDTIDVTIAVTDI